VVPPGPDDSGAIHRDVTEPTQAAQYARSLIEAFPHPLATISAEGRITDVNHAAARLTGADREDLIGTDYADCFSEPEQAREANRQVFANGSITDCPLTIRHKDGRLTEVLYNASLYKDMHGNVLGVFAAARDVTDSKHAVPELVETKSFLDSILQSSIKYSIIGEDMRHHILSWNEGAQRNYRYVAREVLG